MDPTTEPSAIVERPREATRAVQLISASFLIGGIRAVVELTHKVSGVYFLVAIFLLIAFFGICFFLVSKIAAGRNWARIVFIVLVLIGLPFAILGYIQELRTSLLGGSISIIIAVLQLIGTYLLFIKNSNTWFRRPK